MSGEYLITPIELSSKVINTLVTEIQRAQLRGYDPYNQQKQKIVSTRYEALAFTKHVVHEALLFESVDTIGPAGVRKIQPLFSPYPDDDSNGKPLSEVSKLDAPLIARLGFREHFQPGHMGDVAVRTVFGASEAMPLRALSYLPPALQFVEGIRRSGKFAALPQIQYLLMVNSGVAINHLDHNKAVEQASLFIYVANKYIQRFHPDLADLVVFASDAKFVSNDFIQDAQAMLMVDQQVENHPLFPGQYLDQKNGSRAYTALHPLVHDVGFNREIFEDIFRGQFLNAPSVIINIGAQSEKPFYNARQAYKPALMRAGIPILPSVQLFTCQAVPPYMPLKNGEGQIDDVLLRDALSDPRIVPQISEGYNGQGNLLARDLRILEDDTQGELSDFLAEIA